MTIPLSQPPLPLNIPITLKQQTSPFKLSPNLRDNVHRWGLRGKTLLVDRLACAHSEACLVLRVRLWQPLLGRQACNRLYIKRSTPQIFVDELDVSTNKTSFDGMTCVSWHVHVPPWFTSNTGEKRDGETEGRNVIEMR
jgi:hypothetical protein